MRTLIFAAEVTVGAEQLIGGSVAGVLAVILGQLMRRQKDTDERRDALTTLAFDREARAAAERDEAMDELLAARADCADLRARLHVAEYQMRQLTERRPDAPDQ